MAPAQPLAPRLVARWRQAARRGGTVDLQADLMRYTVDTIAGLAFGAEVDTLGSDEDVIQRHLNRIFPALARRLFAPLRGGLRERGHAAEAVAPQTGFEALRDTTLATCTSLRA